MLESTLSPLMSATSTTTSVAILTLAVTSDLVLVRPTTLIEMMAIESTMSLSPTTEPLVNTSAFISSTMKLSVTGTQAVKLATSVSNRLVGPIYSYYSCNISHDVSVGSEPNYSSSY